MLVCRDLEKAHKKYGFEIHEEETALNYKESRFARKLESRDIDVYMQIDNDGTLSIYSFSKYGNEYDYACDLDFLYDMIKDGIIEKVEE